MFFPLPRGLPPVSPVNTLLAHQDLSVLEGIIFVQGCFLGSGGNLDAVLGCLLDGLLVMVLVLEPAQVAQGV